MRTVRAVLTRELVGYFATPVAYVFIVLFLVLIGWLTFDVGGLLDRNQADLQAFFSFHPWVFLLMVPAVSMRLWAEERRQGTLEFLMTLPVAPWQAALGKFLAAWVFMALALAFTWPVWATVAYLGNPDHGAIVTGYLGSLALAGAFLAIGAAVSALTTNQVIAFVITAAVCFAMAAAGLPLATSLVADWAPRGLVDAVATFSFLTRYEAMMRGVISLPDLAFFFTTMGLALYLNILALSGRRDRAATAGAAPSPTRRSRPLIAALLAAILYLTGNLWLAEVGAGARIDLTEHRIYTLSPTTADVVDDVAEPIHVEFYYSTALSEASPGIAALGTRIRGLLRAYERLSGGTIVVEEIDPAPFSEAEDRALSLGLTGLPAGADGDPAYFGLAARNSVDDLAVIPFLQPDREPELEYDLTSLIRSLADPEPPLIGVVSTLPVLGGATGDPFASAPTGPWHVFTLLADAYDLRSLDLSGGSVDADVDLLVLVHPRGLSLPELYAVDQYVMQGRPSLVFVDPVSEADLAQRPPQERFAPAHSDLDPFAASWGIGMDPEHAVADRSAALQVAVRGRPGEQVPFVGWLGYGPPAMAPDDPITARLERLHFAAAGHITASPGSTTTVTPLVQSDPQAMRIAAGALGLHPDPRALLSDYAPGDEALTLAARVTGPAPSAFPGGPPPGLSLPEPVGTGAQPLDIVVVADTDFLNDRFWVAPRSVGTDRVAVPFADNGNFVLNAVESLLGAVDLSGLRGRAVTQRPFTRIADLQADARERFLATELTLRAELERAQEALQTARATAEQGYEAAATQAETLATVRSRLLQVRRDLRDVQRRLREDVNRLETWVRAINILAMPALVGAAAIAVLGSAALRRRQHPAAPDRRQ